MVVEIDKFAGFCIGVTNAISEAEKFADNNSEIYCLGEIVHNAREVKRLQSIGMKTISHENFSEISGNKMLIRAHGEPPETYKRAKESGIEIIDATCPVVIKLQKSIKQKFNDNPENQIVIFGKKGHAEVNGLVGQTGGKAIVISDISEADVIDLNKKIFLFSQTTSNNTEYEAIGKFLTEKSIKMNGNSDKIIVYQTICPSVRKRIPRLQEFCRNHDVIIFVSDHGSSNGKMLFEVCTTENDKSYFVTGSEDIKQEWFAGMASVGISGATSTPLWIMEEISNQIINLSTN